LRLDFLVPAAAHAWHQGYNKGRAPSGPTCALRRSSLPIIADAEPDDVSPPLAELDEDEEEEDDDGVMD